MSNLVELLSTKDSYREADLFGWGLRMYKGLLIDDDAETLLYLERELSESFEIVAASSGEMALELVKKQKFDFIISDYVMSGISGLDTIVAIREHYNNCIPAVIISGNWTREDIQKSAKQLKELHIISAVKPVATEPLSKLFLKLIQKVGSRK